MFWWLQFSTRRGSRSRMGGVGEAFVSVCMSVCGGVAVALGEEKILG